MGQIVSTAAKPKRCNANLLSQVPTPAAGEYILVSSDNSMNAAGQGNFDCYIVGDGTTAATELELKLSSSFFYEDSQYSAGWSQGTLDNNHEYTTDTIFWGNKRIICLIPVEFVELLRIDINEGYAISIHEYSGIYETPQQLEGSTWLGNTSNSWRSNVYTFKPLSSAKTVVVIVAKGDRNQIITPNEGVNISFTVTQSLEKTINNNKENIADLDEELYGRDGEVVTENVTLEQGAMMSDGTKNPPTDTTTNARRIRTKDFVYVSGAFTLTFTNNIQYNIFFYNENNFSSYVKQLGIWETNTTYNGEWKGYIMFGMKNAAGTVITTDATSVTITHNEKIAGLLERVSQLENPKSDGYCIGADLVKNNIVVTKKGTLTYKQAFCIYNEKFYSINGSSIAEQDASFSTLRNVSLSLGHGNALQLGENGHAWASGWDDNKLYEVDLPTLSIISTISLPTNGYTTAAVDEKNMIAYIFQRSSYPDTIATYKFIVYDITNQQIISEKYIEDFSAMQSADFYKGKIYMLYGLGTSASPSGMMAYDTSGDVLAEYSLDIFSSTEPEGVCVERNNKQLYVSDVNGNLYEVSE